ncbi:MAG: hypothetical protein N3I35_13195 [Clostridia bacterium]|nr:hypothetical protein [Clostridia bacterium]
MEMKINNLLLCEMMPEYWNKTGKMLHDMFIEENPDGWNIEKAVDKANDIYKEYRKNNCIKSMLYLEALELPQIVWFIFYNFLAKDCVIKDGRPISPVAGEQDDSWMNYSSYSYINIRGTGKKVESLGSFIDATQILPILRVDALHVAPFFESIMGVIYAQSSFAIIDDRVTHLELEKRGVGRYEQLKYFIDCCHLLNKAAGVDLVTHSSALSRVAISNPETVRWVRFSPDCKSFYNGETLDEQYSKEKQKQMAAHVRELCSFVLEKETGNRYATLEDPEMDLELNRVLYWKVLFVLRSNGYSTIPPHTWNGIGAVGIKGYEYEGNYPIWDCRDINLEDQQEHMYGIQSTFMFHSDMKANRLPYQVTGDENDWRPKPNDCAIDYLSEFFPRMHKNYGFDFLRVDYVDHVFDNTWTEDGGETPICDGLTPSQLFEIARKAKESFPAAGMLADHFENDIDSYRKAGFTLTIGREVKELMTPENVHKMFKFNRMLEKQNSYWGEGGTVTYPIDTHDIANPLFLGKELCDREGAAGMQLRHFFSRFASVGAANRPKYEVVGNHDMSSGIYRTVNNPEGMEWGNHRGVFDSHHFVEDVYYSLKQRLRTALVNKFGISTGFCWWRIDNSAEETCWIAITWIGKEYRENINAGKIHINIPMPEFWINSTKTLLISPLIGIKPPLKNCTSQEWKLSPENIAYEYNDNAFKISCSSGTIWLVEVCSKKD